MLLFQYKTHVTWSRKHCYPFNKRYEIWKAVRSL